MTVLYRQNGELNIVQYTVQNRIVHSTYTQTPTVLLNTADRSSGVVFATSSGLRGLKSVKLMTTGGYFPFSKVTVLCFFLIQPTSRKKLLSLPLSAEVSGVGRSARHSSEHSQTPCSPEQKTFGFSLCVEFWVLGYVKSYSYLVLSDQLYLLQLLPCSVWVAVSAPAVTCSFWAAVSAPDVTLFCLSSCICSSCYLVLSEQLYLLQLLQLLELMSPDVCLSGLGPHTRLLQTIWKEKRTCIKKLKGSAQQLTANLNQQTANMHQLTASMR